MVDHALSLPEDTRLMIVAPVVAGRKGELVQMVHGETRVRMDYRVPSRGLIGFRTEFLTITRGAGIVSHVFDGYGPWVGEITNRLRGSLIADRSGPVTGYAVDALSDRAPRWHAMDRPFRELFHGRRPLSIASHDVHLMASGRQCKTRFFSADIPRIVGVPDIDNTARQNAVLRYSVRKMRLMRPARCARDGSDCVVHAASRCNSRAITCRSTRITGSTTRLS